MRIRIIKNSVMYKKGDVIDVYKSQAMELIKSGVAVLSKDMTEEDMEISNAK